MKKIWQALSPFKKKSTGDLSPEGTYSSERSTLISLLDVYSKCLLEIEGHPIEITQETFDGFSKEIVSGKKDLEESLLELRRYFSKHRVSEHSFTLKTFEDFKNLIWSFVEQMSDDMRLGRSDSSEVQTHLEQLKAAVQTDSLQTLREKSREFIDIYAKHQAREESRRIKNLEVFKQQLQQIKRRLMEADRTSRTDHLTQAYNRRSFDESIRRQASWAELHQQPVSLLVMDIDFFKRINDTHGHDVGDFVLREFSRMAREIFKGKSDYFARIGGEEFAALLLGHTQEMALQRAEAVMNRIRREVFVMDDTELRFTISVGLAQLQSGETHEHWFKRADLALFDSKNAGRDRCTLAQPQSSLLRSA